MAVPLQILLVEDHADSRRALAMLLERDGYSVRTAWDVVSAIDEAWHSAADVVLLDIGLPGVNGYGVARELRALPECSSAFFIALTGFGQASDRERSTAAGFDLHIPKPVDATRLLALLRNIAKRRRGPEAGAELIQY